MPLLGLLAVILIVIVAAIVLTPLALVQRYRFVAAGAVVLGYYLVYWIGVRRRVERQ